MENNEIKDLMQYLEIHHENVPNKPNTEEFCKDCYRLFYVFLGDSSLWWPSFVAYLKILSTRTELHWHYYLAYIKTVDFLCYRQTLENSLI